MEGDVITMQEIFAFKQTGVEADGAVKGYFQATGVRPRFLERLKSRGMTLAGSAVRPVASDGVGAWTPATCCSRCCCSSPSCSRWKARTASGRRSAATRRSASRHGCARIEGSGDRGHAFDRARSKRARRWNWLDDARVAELPKGPELLRYVETSGTGRNGRRADARTARCSAAPGCCCRCLLAKPLDVLAARRAVLLATLPWFWLARRRNAAHPAFEQQIARSAGPDVARAARRPRVPDRGADGGRRDGRADRHASSACCSTRRTSACRSRRR